MDFLISGLPGTQFRTLFTLDDQALAGLGAVRRVADAKPGFPCRVSLEDAEPGETLILLPYQHLQGDTPFRASGPIFVREKAADARLAPNVVPALLRSRVLSVRAYDAGGMMVAAEVVDGRALEEAIGRLLTDESAAYLHVHYAKPGCYACRVDRA